MKKDRLFVFFLLLISFSLSLFSQQSFLNNKSVNLSDTARISLLTSTPSQEQVYTMFGHTAIRVCDSTQHIDYVFNYGLFDFDSPNFMFRFVKGETDYMVGMIEYPFYLAEYKHRGVGVVEQVLNLTLTEKQEIFDALLTNCLPQNRVYRYNYFYDNCSTRPRDIIERSVHGKINYTATGIDQTYRDLVWECVHVQPWIQFGIDLLIGAEADRSITDRQKDFLPLYLMKAYDNASVKNTDGTTRAFLLETNQLTPAPKADTFKVSYSPFLFGSLLFILTIIISLLSYWRRWVVIARLYDTLLFCITGIAGCIIFFLMFFSVHPCTNPNWNLVWLNPLQLIMATLFFVKSLSKFIYYYHFINFVALLAFLLAWSLIPQQLEIAFIPFILSIALRSGMNILERKKFKKKAEYSLPKRR